MQVAAEEQSAEPTSALEAAAAEEQSAEPTITAQAARIIALERELEAAGTAHAAAADEEGPHGLAAWLAAAKCEVYMRQLEAEEGLKELDDLLPLLGDSDKALFERLAALGMKPADAKRFVKALRGDFALWLRKVGCIDYKQQLSKMGYNSIEDMYELQDETDEFIRGKFEFIGQKKKFHLKKLLDGIRAIKP